MKIDIFPHIMTPKYFEALMKKAASTGNVEAISPWTNNPPLSDVALRIGALKKTPGVVQALTLSAPPVETVVSPHDAVELSHIANEEMAELVEKYPDSFVAAAACRKRRTILTPRPIGLLRFGLLPLRYDRALSSPARNLLHSLASKIRMALWHRRPWFGSVVLLNQ